MRARLIVPLPYDPKGFHPPLAVWSDERGTRIHGDGWVIWLKDVSLSEVTPQTIRNAMNAWPSSEMILSEERELPDYPWISHEMLDFLKQWREETLKANRVPVAAA
jgi:hypothetical protein